MIRIGMIFCLLVACTAPEHPAEHYLDEAGPARRSDTLAQVVVRMVERIEGLPLTGDRDVNLAREMIEHRRATLELNEILARAGHDDRLKVFAEALSAQHRQDIALWERFLERHPEVPEAGRRGTPVLMRDLVTLERGDDLDRYYVELMRLHLGDGLDHLGPHLERGQHAEMKEPLRRMVARDQDLLKRLDKIR
jgi:uncharacterized protein (DUF305 family)